MKILFKVLFVIVICISSVNAGYKDLRNEQNSLLTDILVILNDNASSALLMVNDAVGLGYHVNTIHADSVTIDLLNLHRLVMLSTGNNPAALTNSAMRVPLQTYVEEGGNAIIEGGDNAYISFIVHQYPAFRTKILKTQAYVSHNGGNLLVAAEHTSSNLFNSPNFLPVSIGINFAQNSDMDVCNNDKFSQSFYRTSVFPDKAGIIVAPSVINPQIINFCFNYASVSNRGDAKNLLNNCIFNLIGSPVSVTVLSNNIPEKFTLQQNYPNPFNPKTFIKYDLSVSSFVSLRVYNMLGNNIAVLINEKQSHGSYKVDFDGRYLPSGAYYYNMSAGNFISTKRMILLK
ncbi:MAG: T9SS type A sorting domain-containing protein [Ignavibacteria bacterium]